MGKIKDLWIELVDAAMVAGFPLLPEPNCPDCKGTGGGWLQHATRTDPGMIELCACLTLIPTYGPPAWMLAAIAAGERFHADSEIGIDPATGELYNPFAPIGDLITGDAGDYTWDDFVADEAERDAAIWPDDTDWSKVPHDFAA